MCLWPVIKAYIRLMYHLNARTGHQSLSEDTDEKDLTSGTKISCGVKTLRMILGKKTQPREPGGPHLVPSRCGLAPMIMNGAGYDV